MVDWGGVGAAIGSAVAAVLARRAHKSADRGVELEVYLHTRMHDVLNGLYRIALGNAALLRKMGVEEIPDPDPPPSFGAQSEDGAA